MKETSPKPPKEPKPPKDKRKDLLSYAAWDALRDRLCAQLLPPRPTTLTGNAGLKEALDRFAAGKHPDPGHDWDLKHQELWWEIKLCQFHERSGEHEETPWQIEAALEDLKNEWKDHENIVGLKDHAISLLLSSSLDLEQETRDYLAKEWMERVPRHVVESLLKRPNPEQERREFAETIKNLKRLLGSRGVSQEKADDMIAAGLGCSAAALRKRLQPSRLRRARRK